MATAWRITKTKYAATAFTGEGARLYGSRWSSRGLAVAFASSSLSLATLEVLVHIKNHKPLEAYSVLTVEFDPRMVVTIDPAVLPSNWRDFPAPPGVQELGDAWLKGGESLILQVPSVIVETEHNYLINPAHAEFGGIVLSDPSPHRIDPRLVPGS